MSGEPVAAYLTAAAAQLATGAAAEHAYRPALQRLMEGLGSNRAVNDPKRSEHGAPDFVFLDDTNQTLILGYAEAKDLRVDLDAVEKTEQMQRYAGYSNLFLTNYLDFRFYRNGAKYATIVVAEISNGRLTLFPDQFDALEAELKAFLEQPPEKITSAQRLAEIMGGKAQRVRTNVERFLKVESDRNDELLRIFALIRTLLVHDLDEARFADMYAQTLVYGLFAARYNDDTPDSFSRAEARDLVPRSNPFLREFFDHIAGARFDPRLAYIVDELCEVFAVSDVHAIVHKYLDSADDTLDPQDPLIHFYEDFLKAYDPAQRKRMGVYYTPLPVVRFMVRTVDMLLKRDFDLPKGLGDTSKTTATVVRQQKKVAVAFHKVQILDPAVGTATFLNEIVKHLHNDFGDQLGRWPSYAREDLIPRIHGFELMMAPYTVAHLKLGLTLQESGVGDFGKRLGVYLTNSLEQSVEVPQDLFQFGLAEAVAEEAVQAGTIKTETPIMVVIGNPPYSGESSNKTEFATNLVAGYKVEPGGSRKLRERNSKWLNDDYVKFIALAEAMIRRNGTGIVALITNHGYLDNPTFRGMRWRLTQTFDALYVLDLHGNSKKKELAPDGGRDQNVFDIQQGVAILFGVMKGKKPRGQAADVFHAELWGTRADKFARLNEGVDWASIDLDKERFLFVPRDTEQWARYAAGVAVDELFEVSSVGVVTAADKILVAHDQGDLEAQLRRAQEGSEPGKVVDRLRNHEIDMGNARPFSYRPFDDRVVYYEGGVLERAREEVMCQFVRGPNIGLVVARVMKEEPGAFVTRHIMGHKLFSAYDINSVFPLYLWHGDGTRTANVNSQAVRKLGVNLEGSLEPEVVLDYVYGVLYSPSYRKLFGTYLKTDFPRVPIPADQAELDRYAVPGRVLRELHLRPDTADDARTTTYPVAGTDQVGAPRFDDGKVWINEEQYFGGVSEVAWQLPIGGYQPAQKWLKDRRGQRLTSNEIEHYQAIVTALARTEELMHQIDA